MKKTLLALFLIVLPPALSTGEPELLPLLQDLIRMDTSNPPGNETAAARYIQDLLSRDGISSEIIESEPGRGNLVARLQGNGTRPALILLGHLDVVPADPAEWDVSPFSAEVRDQRVWGRGTLDMKGLVAMEVMVLRRLKRENVPLSGDVLLVLCADEEAGGRLGAEFLVKNHWDKIQAKYLFNEGSVGVEKRGIHLYPVQVGEKGVAWMKLTTHGSSGHGSSPSPDNAVARLARAVDALAQHKFPITRTEVMAQFLGILSARLSFLEGLGARYFFHPVLGPAIQKGAFKKLGQDKTLKAVFSHTVSPTMLQAGYKINVIPARAEAMIDARILPGETPEGFRDRLSRIIEESIGPEFDLELLTSSLPNESDFRTEYFHAIEESLKKADPEAVTAPTLSAGATDSRFFREKGVIAYGILPLLLPPEELSGLHGKNERIPMNGLERGAEILYDIVKRMQGVPP